MCFKSLIIFSMFSYFVKNTRSSNSVNCRSNEIRKFQGYLTVQPPLWTIGTSSSRQCAIFCVTDVKCASFYYKETDGCKGFEGVISTESDFRRNSGWRYYVTCKVTRDANEAESDEETTTTTAAPFESKTAPPTAAVKPQPSLDEEQESADATKTQAATTTASSKPQDSFQQMDFAAVGRR